MERLEYLDAVAAPIVAINCDTDQILPARFLQKPRSDDFGQFLFRALRFGPDGVEWERGHDKATAAVRGPVAALLLFTYGRISPSDQRLTVFGDESLLAAWQEKTAL